MKKEDFDELSVNLDIDKVLELLKVYLTVCAPKIEEIKTLHFGKVEYFLFSTLNRIFVNVRALNILMPFYKKDVTFKLPINLILRSLVSDYMTIEYLLTFKDPEDDGRIAQINEINVLNLDFIKFLEAVLTEELSYIQQKEINPWTPEKIQARKEQFYNENKEYFDLIGGKFVLKPLKSFRESTSKKVLEEGSIRNLKISDKLKFDRLKAIGLIEFSMPAYLPYKYYSQFQHPTSNMDDLLLSDPIIFDNRMLSMSLDLVFLMTRQIIQQINLDQDFDDKIHQLQKELVIMIKK